jgi:shikimate dehydrogenase
MGRFQQPAPGLLGIIGNPVRHSLSPPMHAAALRRLGLDARYLPFEIAPGQVRDVLRALAPLGFWGINVTIPYKERVLRLLDEVRPQAAAIGAVNTVVVRQGRLIGHNTDAEGFRRALENEGGAEIRGRTVLLLGAGGAARAVAFACLESGCGSLLIANRTVARARRLRRALLERFPEARIAVVAGGKSAFTAQAAGSDVIVNTTPLGTRPADPLPVPRGALRRGQVVMDIVYRPRVTQLLAAAAAAGARPVDGLAMLLHQGALAFELWTGLPAPLPAMRRALATASRSGTGGA